MSTEPAASHRLQTGPRPRFIGMTLHAIAQSGDEGRGFLEWLAHGYGEVLAVERQLIREFLQARRKPPAEPSARPSLKPRDPMIRRHW